MQIKRVSGWVAGLLALIAVWLGFTQTPQNQTVLTATAPTTNTDGSVLTDLSAIRVFRNLDGGAYNILVTTPYDVEGGEWTYTDQNLTSGTWCYKTTAVRVTGAESDYSNEACKTIDVRVPGAPTGLTAN